MSTGVRVELDEVKDPSLKDQGRTKIGWEQSRMPVFMMLRQNHSHTKPLKGQRIAVCLHITKETAVLVESLKAAGAQVALCATNPL